MFDFKKLLALFSVLVINACTTDSSNSTEKSGETVSNPEGLEQNVVSQDILQAILLREESDTSRFVVSDTSSITIGSVLVGDSLNSTFPSPFLKKVTAVTRIDGNYYLNVENASLDELIDSTLIQIENKNLEISSIEIMDQSFSLDSAQAIEKTIAFSELSKEYRLKIKEMKMGDEDDFATLNGFIAVSAKINNIVLDYNVQGLRRAEFNLEFQYTANLTFTASSTFSGSKDKKVATIHFLPIPLGLPALYLEPQLDLKLISKASLSAQAVFSATGTTRLAYHILYENGKGWSNEKNCELSGNSLTNDWMQTVQGNAYGGVRGELELLINGIAGPKATGDLGLEGTFEYTQKSVSIGDSLGFLFQAQALAEARFGGEFEIFGKEIPLPEMSLWAGDAILFSQSYSEISVESFEKGYSQKSIYNDNAQYLDSTNQTAGNSSNTFAVLADSINHFGRMTFQLGDIESKGYDANDKDNTWSNGNWVGVAFGLPNEYMNSAKWITFKARGSISGNYQMVTTQNSAYYDQKFYLSNDWTTITLSLDDFSPGGWYASPAIFQKPKMQAASFEINSNPSHGWGDDFWIQKSGYFDVDDIKLLF